MKINFGEQLTLWNIEATEKPREIINRTKTKEIEKTAIPSEPTEKQRKFLSKNRIMGNGNLSRLIKYCGGSLGIEMLLPEGYKTIYVNAEGQEEFTKDKKFPVLPMDKIVHYKIANIALNSFQEEKLKDLKVKYPLGKIIKRKGDENVILELDDKVISITPRWVLEFQNVKVVYENDEAIQDDTAEDLKDMQKRVKTGDYVQAKYGPSLIEGTITREYGLCNEILNIIFDNNKKHTAICRDFVVRILKAA